MTPVERRSVGALAAIYASRMLGMFLMLPVLALYAHTLPDYSPEMLGLAMGAYGLTQAVLQIPFGRWSDRLGRKPMITLGLLFYALGSILGMHADSVATLAIARGIQGAGAVSASVTALMADLTRNEVRTRAMAVIGISIGLSFVLALIIAPALEAASASPAFSGSCWRWRCWGCPAVRRRACRAGAHGRGGGPPAVGHARDREPPAAAAAVFRHVRAARDHDSHVHLRAAGAGVEPRHPGRGPLAGLPGRVHRLAGRHGAAGAQDRAPLDGAAAGCWSPRSR